MSLTVHRSFLSDCHLADWTVSGLYYKPMTIVNDDTRIVNKLNASLTDDARVVIYDHHMFIVQATDCRNNTKTRIHAFPGLSVLKMLANTNTIFELLVLE
jgi:hypothetical protein